MHAIPPKLRKELSEDPSYAYCARQLALGDHECGANPQTGQAIEWEHAIIYAGKQVQKRWAIVPLCWWAHSGPGMVKEINVWIALNRASEEELHELTKSYDLVAKRERVNKKYGAYVENRFLKIF